VKWKANRLNLKLCHPAVSGCEDMLPYALHPIRSLCCTVINLTLYKLFFSYTWWSPNGK